MMSGSQCCGSGAEKKEEVEAPKHPLNIVGKYEGKMGRLEIENVMTSRDVGVYYVKLKNGEDEASRRLNLNAKGQTDEKIEKSSEPAMGGAWRSEAVAFLQSVSEVKRDGDNMVLSGSDGTKKSFSVDRGSGFGPSDEDLGPACRLDD